jgi:hypothetical protein
MHPQSATESARRATNCAETSQDVAHLSNTLIAGESVIRRATSRTSRPNVARRPPRGVVRRAGFETFGCAQIVRPIDNNSVMGKKRVREGVNDLATTHPELVEPLVAAAAVHGWELRPTEVTKDSVEVTMARVMATLDLKPLRETHPELADELDDTAEARHLSVQTKGRQWWRCVAHDYAWSATIAQRLRATGCKDCAADSKKPEPLPPQTKTPKQTTTAHGVPPERKTT